MNPTLTEEQRHLVEANPGTPVRLIDPQTNRVYVLVRADVYDRLAKRAQDDYDLRDTYAAQFRSAFAAGWGDPVMDDYDNYEENFQKLCRSREGKSS